MNTNPTKKACYLIAASLLTTANSSLAQTIDASSLEKYEASLKAMGETITDEEDACFQKGFINLMITANPKAEGKSLDEQLELMGEFADSYPPYMDGITKKQIIARGEEISDCEYNAKTTPITEEVSNPKTPQEALKACVSEKVPVSNISVEKDVIGENIILTLTNNLSWPISGVRIRYSISSPERTVPWIKSDTSRSISGGIESGESREFRISTGIFDGNVPPEIDRAELVAEAIVVDVADANGDQLVHEVNVNGDDWSGNTSTKKCE